MRVDEQVLAVLSRCVINGRALVLPDQLERNLYQRTNKVLNAAGGIWTKAAKAHLFEGDATDRIEQVLLTGFIEIPKDEFNFFASTPMVVDRVIKLARIEPGMRVREPSAGRGALAFACAAAGAVVDCDELMEENYKALASDPRLNRVQHVDFLTQTPEPSYQRVVMNPPFAKQADIKHVQHALKFLAPDGLLVSVMAASVTYRDNKLTQDFRDLIRSRGGDIEALPDGAFKASGTMVRTVIVTIPA